MIRTLTLLAMSTACAALFAASGGPDAYGYTWKDSNEPDGPTYDWVDITTTGTLVNGLADDNTVGPFVMQTSFEYYWYSRKFVWIGSNGYIAFADGNIASPFPTIPSAGGTNDFIAGMMSDLNFGGTGNPAQCYYLDDGVVTTISYINVPFWSPTAPGWTGSNTFQIILNTADSTITVQFQGQSGLTQNNDIKVGIESVAGSIGLQHSSNVYPTGGYAIRYYYPPTALLDVTDATVIYNTDPGSGGRFLARDGNSFPMSTVIGNIGNVDINSFMTTGSVLNAAGAVQVTEQVPVNFLEVEGDTLINYTPQFSPAVAGTYRYRTTISGITGELVTTNNQLIQELVVVDTTLALQDLRYHGATDDGIGLSWNGGNGGVGVYIVPPYHPAYATATTIRIVSNLNLASFNMKVYADDGPDNGPGTLLDSVIVEGAQAGPGDKVIPLSAPLTITSGGVYVQWYMLGTDVVIAQDITAPFSLRTFEVLDGTWAEYRDRENIDFFLGLRLEQLPTYDIGCTGFFDINELDEFGSPLTVRAFVKNFGNQSISSFPLNYRFGTGPVVTQNYTGAAIAPGAETLVTFSQPLVPAADGPDALCAWTSLADDLTANNDTVCVNIVTWTGIADLAALNATLAPNPATDALWINGLPEGRYAMEVMSMQGKVLQQLAVLAITGPLRLSINDLSEGPYVVHVHNAQGSFRAPFVVQR
ncbi:MAG: hypothetical protein R2815_00235 [Flavobacteriales bacterium]